MLLLLVKRRSNLSLGKPALIHLPLLSGLLVSHEAPLTGNRMFVASLAVCSKTSIGRISFGEANSFVLGL